MRVEEMQTELEQITTAIRDLEQDEQHGTEWWKQTSIRDSLVERELVLLDTRRENLIMRLGYEVAPW